MGKIIKAKIRKVRGIDGTRFVYPPVWDAGAINVVVYQDDGLDEEYCIGIVADVNLARFTAHKDIVEIREGEANSLGRTWRKPVTSISDEQIVLRALENLRESPFARARLSQEQQDALDPDNEALGVSKSPEFDIRNYMKG